MWSLVGPCLLAITAAVFFKALSLAIIDSSLMLLYSSIPPMRSFLRAIHSGEARHLEMYPGGGVSGLRFMIH